MTNRAAQFLFAFAAVIAALLALALPFPPERPWEQSALVRLAFLFTLAFITVVALSVSPRVGRAVGLIAGIASLGQLIVILIGIPRAQANFGPLAAAVGVSPWLLGVLGGALLLRKRDKPKL